MRLSSNVPHPSTLGRNGFDFSVCARPGGPDQAGGGQKTKTRKQGPEGGPGPQGPSGLGPRWVGEWGGAMVRWAGRVVDGPGRSGRSMGRSGWLGLVVLLLGWPECMEIRLFRGVSATKSKSFYFLRRGPGPSEAASERPLTERSKPHRLGRHGWLLLCAGCDCDCWSPY